MKHRTLDSRLAWLSEGDNASLLRGGLRGLEKESLRVDRRGRLAHTRHPSGLGSALTHPYLTTDYAEALPELVTPPYPSNWETLQFLCDLHIFMAKHLEDELLWAQSMPCRIPSGDKVPIAVYGSSNLGQLRSVYRRGLGFRYGRAMQTISGVHFNYSAPLEFWRLFYERERSAQGLRERSAHGLGERSAKGSRERPSQALQERMAQGSREPSSLSLKDFISGQYMGAIRNYRRLAWLLIYLFGASPAFCKSFPAAPSPYLREQDADTWFAPFGTSLRMSDIGYRNRSQSELQISMNSLDDYLAGMVAAVTTANPRYEAIGVRVDGEYRQLNANTLQMEAEYYSPIRPKPPADNPHRPTVALRENGVNYLEVRTLDLNMMDPLGVNAQQLRFVEALLLYCLLSDSHPIDSAEQAEIDERDLLVAREGRRPGLQLPRAGRTVALTRWAEEALASIREVAALLDEDGGSYAAAVDSQRETVANPELTPSARILHHMRSEGASFFELALETSRQQHRYFAELRLPAEKEAWLEELARESLEQQALLEAEPEKTFEDYLRDYFARA